MAMVPRLDQRADVARDLRTIFNSIDRAEAEARLKNLFDHQRNFETGL